MKNPKKGAGMGAVQKINEPVSGVEKRKASHRPLPPATACGAGFFPHDLPLQNNIYVAISLPALK
jgi:hypothetical protein